MKNILFAAAIFLIVLTFSCKKSSENPANNLFVGADFQGTTWIAQPSTEVLTNDTLVVRGFNSASSAYMLFKVKFYGVGNYTLTAGSQGEYYTSPAGTNTITSQYKLDTTQTNTVTFTSYNFGTRIATGSFQLNFVKTSGGSAFSNTANFTSGQFWIALPPE